MAKVERGGVMQAAVQARPHHCAMCPVVREVALADEPSATQRVQRGGKLYTRRRPLHITCLCCARFGASKLCVKCQQRAARWMPSKWVVSLSALVANVAKAHHVSAEKLARALIARIQCDIAVDAKTKTGCSLWNGTRDKDGYGEVKVLGKKWRTHRLVFALSNGREARPDVCHTCDTPPCVDERHLFEGTNKENLEDCVNKGRHAFGERAGNSVLTEAEVVRMRALREAGSTYAQLMKRFSVTKSCVCFVITRRTWRHL